MYTEKKVEIIPKKGQRFREAAGDCVLRYWDCHGDCPVICNFDVSFDGKEFENIQTIAFPAAQCGHKVEFYDDWYMGIRRAFLCGMMDIERIDVSGYGTCFARDCP